jgi:hypothetical protein
MYDCRGSLGGGAFASTGRQEQLKAEAVRRRMNATANDTLDIQPQPAKQRRRPCRNEP